MINLWGANLVGRDGKGHSYATHTCSMGNRPKRRRCGTVGVLGVGGQSGRREGTVTGWGALGSRRERRDSGRLDQRWEDREAQAYSGGTGQIGSAQ